MNGLYGKLARRYLWGKQGRSLMTLLGIALGVTMVVAVLLINSALMASYANLLEAAAGRADLQVSATSGFGFNQSLLEQVRTAEGVAAAVPVVTSSSPVVAGERQAGATFYGIDPASDPLVRDYNLTAGRLPQAAAEVAVTTDLASALDLQAGSRLSLLTTRGLKEFTVSGIFSAAGTARGALGPFGVMQLAEAQEAFGKQGKLDLIDLVLAPGAEAKTVTERLAGQLGAGVRVAAPVERSRDMQKLLDAITFMLTLAGALSLFAGAFIIYTNVSMGVAERRRDLSVLRALGMRRAEVMTLVLGEAAGMGLLGALPGLAWGYGLAAAMAGQMTDQFLVSYGLQTARIALTPTIAAAGLAVGLLATLAAAFAPARETLQVSPVEAMRPGEGQKPERHGWPRFLAGAGLTGAGALFVALTWPAEQMLSPLMLRLWGAALALMLLGVVVLLPALLPPLNRGVLAPLLRTLLGVTGRLASDNLVRHPRRTAATVCALMVSLSYMVAMGGVRASQQAAFERWFDKNIGWDMNVSTSFTGIGSQVEIDPAFAREVAAIPGVRLVAPQKFTRITLADGQPAFLQALDHKLLKQYSETPLEEGVWADALAAMERGGSTIISPAVARRLGAGLGDTVTLPTPTGNRTLTVVGIMTDVTPYGGTLNIDWQDYVAGWQDESSSNLAVLVAEGADPAAVRNRILAAHGERMHLNIRLNREFWAEIRAQYDSFYQLMDGLIWVALAVSGLALANTLFASVLERRREIGLLRSVGTRRGEVVRIVLGEALSTGLVAGLIGIAAGLALQWVMVSTNESINGANADMTMAWGSLLTAVAVAVLLAPAVGWLPARWAARLDVVEALRYE